MELESYQLRQVVHNSIERVMTLDNLLIFANSIHASPSLGVTDYEFELPMESFTGLFKKSKVFHTMLEYSNVKTYDCLVGYCEVKGSDFAKMMMDNSQCKVWREYDVWDRY